MLDALLLYVIDGDTLKVRLEIWPDIFVETSARLDGVDAPEIRGEKCPEEEALGFKAKERVEQLVAGGFALEGIGHDKYGGRIDAIIRLPNGASLADILMIEGLVKAWPGGKGPKPDWCGGWSNG